MQTGRAKISANVFLIMRPLIKVINLADTYVNPNDRAELLETLKTTGGVVDYPALLKRKDGTKYNASLTIGIVNIAGKNVIQTLLQDITERKRMEDALLFTRFLLDNAVEVMVCLSQDARYIDVNDAFCRSVGYSREELLSMTAHDIDPNYSAEIWPEFWEKLKRSGSLTFESCHRRKDGKVFPVEVSVTFFKYKGKEYHCGFARDITERKQAEEALKKKESFN
jgi:PAS domain S-box-containing protein